MIYDYAERHYPFEGCFNFRDIGGYLNQEGQRVKKGLYFRTCLLYTSDAADE